MRGTHRLGDDVVVNVNVNVNVDVDVDVDVNVEVCTCVYVYWYVCGRELGMMAHGRHWDDGRIGDE